MAGRIVIPRVKVGDTVYRVDWKKDEAVILEYTVVSQSPGSFVLSGKGGKDEKFSGKENLALFALDEETAIERAFISLAAKVEDKEVKPIDAMRQTSMLAKLL
ncbi:MAG: hypothetical protein RLZZ458_1771 [Planctomycetota bacterium]|jgi:hypothetical protein